MAQKSKAAARPASKSKGAAAAKSKSAPAKVASAKKAAVTGKAKVKPVVKAKAPAPAPARKVAVSKPDATAPPAENEIRQAKAALRKENGAAAPKAKVRKIAIEVSPNEALSALAQKWATLYKKAEQIEAKPYNMKAVFEEKTAITHKVLGWGFILANRNDRLEVLFKDGIKYLISNYKP